MHRKLLPYFSTVPGNVFMKFMFIKSITVHLTQGKAIHLRVDEVLKSVLLVILLPYFNELYFLCFPGLLVLLHFLST